jgi:MFS superfamily sulfate permease-like transporter
MKKYFQHIGSDLSASIVILLVALPLCLGIALGSGAPLFSGIIAGVVGGIVVGLFSGSHLSVSGPAAGLTVIVASAIIKLQVYEAFLLAVVLAGIFQLILGFIKAGVIGDYVPNSVIKGMLAAIGIILILKQLPHIVGYDTDFVGDQTFMQNDHQNTFTEMFNAIQFITPSAALIGLVSLTILILWGTKGVQKNKILSVIPGPLIVVLAAVAINEFIKLNYVGLELDSKHLVSLPVAENVESFISFFQFPNIRFLNNPLVWTSAFTIAIVASLETLLGIEAVDKLDPLKRVTPTNRELKAQGIGNIISGLIGGIPVTSVVVRSAANVNAGGKTKMAAITHGILLMICVIFIPTILNKIPLSALAAVLIYTGYKLVKLPLFKEFFNKGWDQFVPFIATILAILFTDLLVGIIIGILVALFFLMRSNFRSAIFVVNNDHNYLIRLRKDVSFLNKPIIKRSLNKVPDNSFVIIDATRADFIDKDIIDEVNTFLLIAYSRNIKVEIKKSLHKPMHLLFNNPKTMNV